MTHLTERLNDVPVPEVHTIKVTQRNNSAAQMCWYRGWVSQE
jgi:hypothetical protein